MAYREGDPTVELRGVRLEVETSKALLVCVPDLEAKPDEVDVAEGAAAWLPLSQVVSTAKSAEPGEVQLFDVVVTAWIWEKKTEDWKGGDGPLADYAVDPESGVRPVDAEPKTSGAVQRDRKRRF